LTGLDELYDVEPDSVQASTADASGTAWNKQDQPSSDQGTAEDLMAQGGNADSTATWMSVENAGRRLGISANAVIKRLGKGKLRGRKVPGQFGDKWMVDPEALPKEVHIEIEGLDEEGTAQEQPGHSKGTDSRPPSQPGNSVGIAEKSLELLGEVIRQQNDHMRSQSELIKHLTDQVTNLQTKLLTDSGKTNWWSRFSSWFFGKN
jgi:hypothetical protein